MEEMEEEEEEEELEEEEEEAEEEEFLADLRLVLRDRVLSYRLSPLGSLQNLSLTELFTKRPGSRGLAPAAIGAAPGRKIYPRQIPSSRGSKECRRK